MKIISWNVNGIRASIKKGLTDYVLAMNPDIFCVQETKAEREQVPTDNWPPAGYRDYYHSCSVKGGYSGVATFTKIEPVHVQRAIGIEKFDQEGRVMQTDFEEFTLLNVYFPNGGARDERLLYKLDFYDAFFEYCESLRAQGKKLLICGDYNICHEAIDIHDPIRNAKISGFLPEEREWMTTFLSTGWVDTFREFNTKPHHYSWWSQRFPSVRLQNKGWRIDYLCTTDAIADRIINASILPLVKHSDHCPIVLDLK